jgi:hypothetical protein
MIMITIIMKMKSMITMIESKIVTMIFAITTVIIIMINKAIQLSNNM